VLLSRRAETLRNFPGDTSLPGGRYEPGDRTLEDTARREAFEEIGLPRDRHRIPLLCYLQPFLAGTNLLVTPVVVLILDPDVRPILNEPEVSALFSHPLHAFLLGDVPFARHHLPHSEVHPHAPNSLARHHLRIISVDSAHAAEPSIPDLPPIPPYANGGPNSVEPSPDKNVNPVAGTGRKLSSREEANRHAYVGWKRQGPNQVEEDAPRHQYYSYRDIPWGQSNVRMHRFLTGREDLGVKPVYGLTAAILLHTAIIGYRKDPEFNPCAPGEKSQQERIAYALCTVPMFIEAVRKDKEERNKFRRERRLKLGMPSKVSPNL